MSEDDPFEDIDVPEDPTADLDQATQQLTVRIETRRYGKAVTIIEGLEHTSNAEDLAPDLKSSLGTGGTVKEGAIELQGDHESRVRAVLEEKGYQLES